MSVELEYWVRAEGAVWACAFLLSVGVCEGEKESKCKCVCKRESGAERETHIETEREVVK